ncbi:MAG: TetR/AcrR family transcriptional regulator [Solirubrobacteraceae bacterium]
MDQELSLRERKKEKTRRLIADTARRLFVERGFEAVPVAEIARAAEVSEATVFNYFPTKEDLVYWRLGSFEDELLATIRARQSGESALSAFRRFLLAQRGLLGQPDEASREQLVGITRVISESQALRAREQQILAGYTSSLAWLLVEEGGGSDELDAIVAANAMMGVHRALIQYTRSRILDGVPSPRLARDVRARAERAFLLLERGLGDYARKGG